MSEGMRDFFKYGVNIIDNALGGADRFDEPVWSGKWMIEFFGNYPVKREELDAQLIEDLCAYVQLSCEEAIPAHIFQDNWCGEFNIEVAKKVRHDIIRTFVPQQMEADDIAKSIVEEFSRDESMSDKWYSYFTDLFMFAAQLSFKAVNGYDFEFFNGVADTGDDQQVENSEVDKCTWPGIYAFICNASGYIKIGMSSKEVKGRVKTQLSSLPKGGVFIGAVKCDQASHQEGLAHSKFAKSRLYKRKEWFDCGVDEVVAYFNLVRNK